MNACEYKERVPTVQCKYFVMNAPHITLLMHNFYNHAKLFYFGIRQGIKGFFWMSNEISLFHDYF